MQNTTIYSPPKVSIKSWAEDDRPREKLQMKGRDALSEAELIAILIGSGSAQESAVDLSQRILNDQDNNLTDLGKLNIEELTQYKGIGPAKAISIIAALELGRRRQKSVAIKKKSFATSREVFELLQPIIGDLSHEEFYVLFLHQNNTLKKLEKISSGGLTGTIVDVRILLKKALENLTPAFIIAHNHPSGNLNPSPADIRTTHKIHKAALTMDIHLLDHLIITSDGYYSFADNGKLTP